MVNRHRISRRWRVRKHRAPKGALRQVGGPSGEEVGGFGQKAPSAKRCIETWTRRRSGVLSLSQKAPSAIRCIKTRTNHLPHLRRHTPESTERLSTNTKCPLTPHRTHEPPSAKPTPHPPQTRDTTPDHTQTDRPTR